MRVNTTVIIDIHTGEVVLRKAYNYAGPVARALNFGGSKSKQKSTSTSSSESGTAFNPNFLTAATAFAATPPGKQRITSETLRKRHTDLEDEYNRELGAAGTNDPRVKQLYDEIHNVRDQIRSVDQMGGEMEIDVPGYSPNFVRAGYTPGQFTPVAGGNFDRLEENLYAGQQSKIARAYNEAVGRQREELAQAGALTSPSQFLEGSVRSSLDRNYLESLQQAARDAFTGRLGLEEREAGRRTGFDVGEATRRTGFEQGEAARETQFNEKTAQTLLELFLKKLGIAIESGRYATGQSSGTSSGGSMGGNFGLFSFGGGD